MAIKYNLYKINHVKKQLSGCTVEDGQFNSSDLKGDA